MSGTEQAKMFLNEFADAAADLFDGQREDLARFINDEGITALTAEFIATGNESQLAVIAFRLRTFARRSTIQWIQFHREKLTDLMLILGRIAAAFVAP